MEYKVYIDLIYLINQQQKRLVNNVFFVNFIFLSFSVIMYFKGGKVLDLLYLLCEFIFLGVLGYIQYYQTVPNGEIVNNTAIEVEILNEEIIVKTSPFKVLFWFNKESKDLRFKLSELNVRKSSYPFKPVYDLDNRILTLTDDEKVAYVIIDFFNEELKQKLLEINSQKLTS